MLTGVMVDTDMRQFANAKQAAVSAQPTTSFCGAQYALPLREAALGMSDPVWHGSLIRRKVIQSLERSLKEHHDVWSELAQY